MVHRGNGVSLLLSMAAILVPILLAKPAEGNSPNQLVDLTVTSFLKDDIAPGQLTGWQPTNPERHVKLVKVAETLLEEIIKKNGGNRDLLYNQTVSEYSTTLAKSVAEKMLSNTSYVPNEHRPNPLVFYTGASAKIEAEEKGEDDDLLIDAIQKTYDEEKVLVNTNKKTKDSVGVMDPNLLYFGFGFAKNGNDKTKQNFVCVVTIATQKQLDNYQKKP